MLFIELQYLPPVSVYSALINQSHIYLDKYELYRKMSFRNRCIVHGANGPISLSIPLELGRNQKTPISEVRIANRYHWQEQHWKTIESAYRKAPWFDNYALELGGFFQKRYDLLWDWNMVIFRWALEKLKMDIEIIDSAPEAGTSDNSGIVDLRNQVLPKNYQLLPSKPYLQVFSDRSNFLPNLSVLDLLFCEGKHAMYYL